MLKVSEIFGPTFQGEGTATGRFCLFVRLGECNLTCTWCDTPYTWAFTPTKAAKTQGGVQYNKLDQVTLMALGTIIAELNKLWPITTSSNCLIVVSGGEPLLQAPELEPLVRALSYEYGHDVHIETAGTLMPSQELVHHTAQFNVSPKLAHSGNSINRRFQPGVLKYLYDTGKAQFKFVVREVSHLDEVDMIVKQCGIRPEVVSIMPEGTTIEAQLEGMKYLAPHILERGYSLSPRLHVLIWGNKRGVLCFEVQQCFCPTWLSD